MQLDPDTVFGKGLSQRCRRPVAEPPNLQELNLNWILYFPIFLQEINGDAFKHLKILVELNLSHNNITHIEKGTFRGNDRLQTLNLAGNQVGATNDLKYLTKIS